MTIHETGIKEIVGAIIDGISVSMCRKEIDASIAGCRDVQYISRGGAMETAMESRSQRWVRLATAPTLFLIDNGVRFAEVEA